VTSKKRIFLAHDFTREDHHGRGLPKAQARPREDTCAREKNFCDVGPNLRRIENRSIVKASKRNRYRGEGYSKRGEDHENLGKKKKGKKRIWEESDEKRTCCRSQH